MENMIAAYQEQLAPLLIKPSDFVMGEEIGQGLHIMPYIIFMKRLGHCMKLLFVATWQYFEKTTSFIKLCSNYIAAFIIWDVILTIHEAIAVLLSIYGRYLAKDLG